MHFSKNRIYTYYVYKFITLKPKTLKTWALSLQPSALSLHICSLLEQDIAKFAGGEQYRP